MKGIYMRGLRRGILVVGLGLIVGACSADEALDISANTFKNAAQSVCQAAGNCTNYDETGATCEGPERAPCRYGRR